MTVVAYEPALDGQNEPMQMSFFEYGCCVSTSQTLWVIILSFIFAVLVVLACCMSAIFVRWVYKRRLRKKVEAIKEKHRQEERERRERQFELERIAKKPTLPKGLKKNGEINQLVEKIVASRNSAEPLQPPAVNHLHPVNQLVPVVPLPCTEQAIPQPMCQPPRFDLPPVAADSPMEKETATVPMDVNTMAGLVHEIANTDICQERYQPPFPGITLGIDPNPNAGRERGKDGKVDEEQEDVTQPSPDVKESMKLAGKRGVKELSADTTKKAGGAGGSRKERDSVKLDKTQDEEEQSRRKSKVAKRSLPKQSSDFPYYTGAVSSANPSKRDTSSSFETTHKLRTESSPTVAPSSNESLKKTPVKEYNVYELRRFSEEQTRLAETQEACELIRNRQTDKRDAMGKLKGETAVPPKRVAQPQKANDVGLEMDSPRYKG